MQETRPDVFLHSGDTIYADAPIEQVVGRVRAQPVSLNLAAARRCTI